ncbi:oxidoreductase, short chain dehydrogenase/reductase family [Chondromyces apiculatus DSM 436]|uniref:Oxidoreductase, short chain dehydrogenase/reductase family n=1 Tax=Chondromyces apiculatus DSM 436 TaxID=1192034 RepID=A0A017T2A1_9BACT|nr:oxidoreductase, short chain dehydrogenase/reductase family [Chondromyces apiculatus DSM 436]
MITGAASGLGHAFALELARSKSARVLVADVNLEGAEETARLVREAGGEASTVKCDVSRREEVLALPDEADRALGGTDFLINNAGVAVGGMMGDVPLEDWDWVMGINLWGVIYGCHAFAPRLRAQRHGAILNVASAAGLLCAPPLMPYNVTKAGVVALSETLRAELGPSGVTVTVLCPTFFKTGIAASGRTHVPGAGPEAVERMMARSKVQADGVAQFAIKAVDRGDLYALPHADGRVAWHLKRSAPQAFYDWIVPRVMRRMK